MTARRLPTSAQPLAAAFYERPVLDVARALIGCVVSCGSSAGVIVETEAYHQSEPACHAFVGLTPRTTVLFGPPGVAYVYRSYGIHACLNAVCEPEGTGAAVLIRALEPLDGIEAMRARRGLGRLESLCSGPGRLTQALGITLDHNGSSLGRGPVVFSEPAASWGEVPVAAGPRVGITKAAELPWRFCVAGSPFLSRPAGAAVPSRRGRRSVRARRET